MKLKENEHKFEIETFTFLKNGSIFSGTVLFKQLIQRIYLILAIYLPTYLPTCRLSNTKEKNEHVITTKKHRYILRSRKAEIIFCGGKFQLKSERARSRFCMREFRVFNHYFFPFFNHLICFVFLIKTSL